MSNKIYGHDNMGCEYEVISRQELEKTYPYVPVSLNDDGTFNLEVGMKYKVFKKDTYIDKYGFSFVIKFSNGLQMSIEPKDFDKYQNYVYFKVLEISANSNYQTQVVYEINDIRTTKIINNGLYTLTKYSCLFDPSDGTVYGNGETYFTYAYEERETLQVQKSIILKTIDNKPVTTGDQNFVENLYTYLGNDDLYHIGSIKWKASYEDNGVQHSTTDTQGLIAINTSGEYYEKAHTTYQVDDVYVVTTYSWKDRSGYTLCGQEVNGNDYIAYYRPSGSTASSYTITCSNFDHALICNDEATAVVEIAGSNEGVVIYTPIRE